MGLAGLREGDGEVAAYHLFVSVVCTTISAPATVAFGQTEDSVAPGGLLPRDVGLHGGALAGLQGLN